MKLKRCILFIWETRSHKHKLAVAMMDACAFSLRQHFRLKERSVAGCRVGGVKEIFIWAFFGVLRESSWKSPCIQMEIFGSRSRRTRGVCGSFWESSGKRCRWQ